MDILSFKLLFIVAIVTQIRNVREQQFRQICRVRVVTGGTTHRKGGMHGLLGKKSLIMAAVTQVRNLGGQAFLSLHRPFVGHT
jgi:hypothetical protein